MGLPSKTSWPLHACPQLGQLFSVGLLVWRALYSHRRISAVAVQPAGAQIHPVRTSVLAAGFLLVRAGHDLLGDLHRPVYRGVRTAVLRLDLPTDHFHGKRVSQD